ncbi:MAG: response regulator [Acidimicrobiia bacterium]|nr:response regulator [Acidimicrobiia bacterium]
MGLAIEKAGYEVCLCEDGLDALEKYDEFKPDLVVTDLLMPRLNGFELIEKIREKYGPKIQILVLSNLDNLNDRQKAMALGTAGFLIKSDSPLSVIKSKIILLLDRDMSIDTDNISDII